MGAAAVVVAAMVIAAPGAAKAEMIPVGAVVFQSDIMDVSNVFYLYLESDISLLTASFAVTGRDATGGDVSKGTSLATPIDQTLPLAGWVFSVGDALTQASFQSLVAAGTHVIGGLSYFVPEQLIHTVVVGAGGALVPFPLGADETGDVGVLEVDAQLVPEPSSLLLLATGSLLATRVRHRRR